MIKLIVKYWKPIALAVLGIALIGAVKYYANKNDDAIAQMVADKVMAKHHAAVKKIRDKYEPLIAKADRDLVTLQSGVDDLNGKIDAKNNTITKQRKEIAKFLTCDDKLVATNVLLDQAQGFILYVNREYQIKVGALNLAWAYKYDLKSAEFDELAHEHEKTIAELGVCVKRATLSLLGSKKRVYLGVGVGYNPITGQPAVSVGAFYGIVRLPIKLF